MGDAHRHVAELVGDVAASGEASCTAEDLFGDGGIEGEVRHGSVSQIAGIGPTWQYARRRTGMRTYYDIQLGDRTVTKRELAGEELVNVGRYHIAKTLLELGAATVDPLSPANPLIFSAGPFAGSSFSNANRTSVGCKSPLTGGVKEANGGGQFG